MIFLFINAENKTSFWCWGKKLGNHYLIKSKNLAPDNLRTVIEEDTVIIVCGMIGVVLYKGGKK